MQYLRRLLTLSLVAVAGTAPAASGQLIPLEWDGDAPFSREMALAPGQFLELCGRLRAGEPVRWRFAAPARLDFNIHFHEGEAVRYPARRKAVARMAGTLRPPAEQDYCWMWTNPSGSEISLSLELRRR